MKDCTNERITNNEITTNQCIGHAIHLRRCSASEITGNTITKTGNYANGIRLESGSSDNVVTRNSIRGSGEMGSYGILVYGSDGNLIDDNTVTETGTEEGCHHPEGSVICGYYADDNNGVFLVDADDNSLTGNTVQVDHKYGWGNAVRLGACRGETGNVIADNELAGLRGIILWSTPTNSEISDNVITGSQEGTGIWFRSNSNNTVRGNTITGFDQGLLFRETSAGNLVEHNNIYANDLAVYNQQSSAVDVRRNYWGTPCPPTTLFEEATGNIEWFPQLTSLYPPAIVAGDENGDGVADVCSRCPVTGSENVPTAFLLVDHYAETDGDGVFDTNVGSAAFQEIVSSGFTLVDTYGCTCQQILAWKPGNNAGEIQSGCTEGTMTTWVLQTDWAAK